MATRSSCRCGSAERPATRMAVPGAAHCFDSLLHNDARRRVEMKTRIYKTSIAATLGALLVGTALAQDAATLSPVQTSGPVQYLSGGIGKDEATAIQQASRQWPLTLEFAVKD